MTFLPMPPVKAGSPQTTITEDINQTDTHLDVADISGFPDVGDTNNFVWLSSGKTVWEVCQYTAKVATTGGAGYLTIVRSGPFHFSSAGTAALAWTAGAKAARNIGKPDFDILQNNIAFLNGLLELLATTPATTGALGLVRIGDRLSINSAGLLSADEQTDSSSGMKAFIFG
jgi:hypothetical protein